MTRLQTFEANTFGGHTFNALYGRRSPAAVAPVITTATLPGGTVGIAYTQTLAATGTTPITWTLDTGTMPTGLSLSTAGVLSGTPTTAASYTLSVKATNSAGSDTKSYTVAVAVAPTVGHGPVIQTTTIYVGHVGTPYATALHATGTMPITWALVSGTLPPGLTLNPDGSITGTPTTQGMYTFVVSATNADGTVQGTVTGGVDPATLPPPTIDVPHAIRPATLDGCWSSWSEQQQQNLLRTQMDSGAIKVRRRTTGIARVAQVSVSMQATKYAAFMSWYNVNCQQGVLPTPMCTPQCKEELWRFVEAPQISWISKDAFTASATIERMPGW